jgi:TetR/AcrR family transcriptional repressor of lmrAB and yxaGH operons
MVDAATLLFSERGYADVSLLEVVERANVSRGSIYHHFPEGKAQLGSEVATAWRHNLERQVLRLAARADTPEAFVRAYLVDVQRDLTESDFGTGCPMTGILANIGGAEGDPLRSEVGRTFDVWHQSIAAVFVQKGLEPERANRLAVAVVSSIQGAIIVSRATRTVSNFAAIISMLPIWFAQEAGEAPVHVGVVQ